MINFNHVTLRRGKRVLLENITWTIENSQRIGIVGANGSGKSSLFALLLNELECDSGELSIPKQLQFAYVAQETPGRTETALAFVMDGDAELRQLQKLLQNAEQQHDGHKIAELHGQIATIDGYRATSRAAKLLVGLGFTHAEHQMQVREFSGGFRVRLNLARALMSRSDVLLLDEPTNHLDLDAVMWLETWLQTYKGTLLLISHDRDFLDNTVNTIAHIDHQQLKIYAGNYSQFETERANQLELQQKQYEKQQQQIAHMQSFVDRFRYKATKARQAQSRLKAIERLPIVAKVQVDSPFYFEFKPPKQCPYPLLYLDHVDVGYGDKKILDDVNLSISPGDRICILGPNGAGKSSLLKTLAAEIPVLSGELVISKGLKLGYFAQHQVDQLQLDKSPMDHLRELSEDALDLDLRKFLGGFGFTGDDVFERVSHYSGGEKSRLALALIVWQKPNLLLLDEPTNHLDMQMRHAINLALQDYQGALVLVTHDRFLIRSTTDSYYLVANEQVLPFTGDLNQYARWLLDFRKQAFKELDTESRKDSNKDIDKDEVKNKKEQRKLNAKAREDAKPRVAEINKLESEITNLHLELASITDQLSDSSLYEDQNKQALQTLLMQEAQIKKELQIKEERWLQLLSS